MLVDFCQSTWYNACVMLIAQNETTNTNTVTTSVTSSATPANVNTNTNAETETTTKNVNINTNTESIQVPKAAQDALHNVNLSNPSWDTMIILFFIISTFLYGWSLGRDRIIIMLVSIYMALTVVQALPDFVLNIKINDQFAFQLTTFVALFVALFFLISRSALSRTLGSSANDGRWYQTILFSFLHVGLLISITMSFLPADVLQKFSPFTQHIFRGEWQAFGWIVAPVVAMMLFGGGGKSKKEER